MSVRSLRFAAILAMLAGPAMAQTPAPPAPGPTTREPTAPAPTRPAPTTPAPTTAPATGVAPAAAAPAAAKAHPLVEKRIEMLRNSLKITPDQTKAFNEFAQVMRDNANKMDTLLVAQSKTLPTMTAVDQMKAYEAITQAHADDMQREVPAFSRLYDTLDPAQKKAADDSFREASAGPKRR